VVQGVVAVLATLQSAVLYRRHLVGSANATVGARAMHRLFHGHLLCLGMAAEFAWYGCIVVMVPDSLS
jgi:hypothetical protein